MSLLVSEFYINGIVQHLLSWSDFFHFDIMSMRVNHFVACSIGLQFFIAANIILYEYTTSYKLILLFIDIWIPLFLSIIHKVDLMLNFNMHTPNLIYSRVFG